LRVSLWSGRAPTVNADLQPLADSERGRKTWVALESRMEKFWASSEMAQDQWIRTGKRLLFWREPVIEIAGMRFVCPIVDGSVRPLVLTPEYPELVISLPAGAKRLHVLGNVTIPDGYPVAGKIGQTVATYTLNAAGRKSSPVPVRNGFETARANLIFNATRIDPIALNAPRALLFRKDPAREHYQALVLTLAAAGAESLTCKLAGDQPLFLFAVTAEQG
jgi:hypothetical protein